MNWGGKERCSSATIIYNCTYVMSRRTYTHRRSRVDPVLFPAPPPLLVGNLLRHFFLFSFAWSLRFLSSARSSSASSPACPRPRRCSYQAPRSLSGELRREGGEEEVKNILIILVSLLFHLNSAHFSGWSILAHCTAEQMYGSIIPSLSSSGHSLDSPTGCTWEEVEGEATGCSMCIKMKGFLSFDFCIVVCG